MGGVNCQNDILIECARMLCSYYIVGKSILRSCLEFIPAFYKECFRGFLFVLMRSIAGYVTNKNGEKDRKQI